MKKLILVPVNRIDSLKRIPEPRILIGLLIPMLEPTSLIGWQILRLEPATLIDWPIQTPEPMIPIHSQKLTLAPTI
ncbi:MAG: hypothetical protein E6364_08100, partial [Staphylococcus sp.]|nr:hypothetical protein [Staphylococcus sp.]